MNLFSIFIPLWRLLLSFTNFSLIKGAWEWEWNVIFRIVLNLRLPRLSIWILPFRSFILMVYWRSHIAAAFSIRIQILISQIVSLLFLFFIFNLDVINIVYEILVPTALRFVRKNWFSMALPNFIFEEKFINLLLSSQRISLFSSWFIKNFFVFVLHLWHAVVHKTLSSLFLSFSRCTTRQNPCWGFLSVKFWHLGSF